MKKAIDLTTGNISQHLLHLSLPLILGNLLQQLYNTADAFVLGHFSGNLEFAAVGIAGSVMNLFLFMIAGACTGISIIFAQLYGAGNLARFRQEHWLALLFGELFTVACSILGFFCLPPLLQMIHTPDSLVSFVNSYLSIIMISLSATFLYNLYSALLRSVGHTGASLMSLTIAVMINLILDYFLIVKFHQGIIGAAWATAISQTISAILCILYLRFKMPELFFHYRDCRINTSLLRQTVLFSSVTSLHQSSLYIGKLLVQGAVNTGGADMISAYTAATRIEGFANSFGDSGSSATSVLIAQNYGAGNQERVQKSFKSSLLLMLSMGITMSLVMYVSVRTSVSLMLGTDSGVAFENACSYLKIISLFYIFCFIGNTFSGYFDGIGKVRIPFIGSAGHITLRVILSWLLIAKAGLPAVALASGIGWLAVTILWSAVKYFSEKKIVSQPEYRQILTNIDRS